MKGKTVLLAGVAMTSVLVTSVAMAASADNYPTRSVRLIIPYPPAGAGDIVGRMISVKLSESMGQQFVVDNRGGGAQVIATEMAARAQPDGYTVFLSSATHGINPGLRGKLPYDTLKDFAPITLVAESPLIFVAHPLLGVSSIKELVAVAKTRPGKINYASSGPGTGGHLSVELLKYQTGIDLTHIPYKGAGPALVDVLAGQVQVMCTSPLPALPHVKSGRLRGLAMTSKNRSRAAPDLPTVAEQGVPGYESTLWYALLAPAATPQPIIRKLHAETVKVLKSPDIIEQLAGQGADAIGNTPQETQKFIAAEVDRWIKVVKQAGIRPE